MKSVKIQSDNVYPKLNLYSGHDINVLGLLSSLNLVEPHLPEFTSAVIVELLSFESKYYVKVCIQKNNYQSLSFLPNFVTCLLILLICFFFLDMVL